MTPPLLHDMAVLASSRIIRRLLSLLGAYRAFNILCLYAMTLLVLGTVAQRWVGLLQAHETYFESWFFWFYHMPLPAMRLILALMAINLLARMLMMPLTLAKGGLWLAHVAALMLMLGGVMAGIGRQEHFMLIPEGQSTSSLYAYDEERGDDFKRSFTTPVSHLPFRLSLKDVVKETHTGTEQAKEYRSELIIDDAGLMLPVKLQMNEPLRYRGYTFYQSSYLQSEEKEATILAVKKSGFWLYPYLATAMLALGLGWHAWSRRQGHSA